MSFRYNLFAGILTALFVQASTFAAAETVTYTYDTMQRLIRAQYSSGPVFEYVYDNMGNRLGRNVYTAVVPANNPPNQAASPLPADGATGVIGPLTLSWTGSDPNIDDHLSFFVYVGVNANSLPLIWSGSAASFSPWGLAANTTYFWKVVTRDSHNAELAGPVWSFTTGNAVVNGLPVNLAVYLTGTGGGTVTSAPAGIACTGASTDTCDYDFPYGSSVTLMSVIDGSSKFAGWSVASCANSKNCAPSMTGDSIVTANFESVPPVRIIMIFPDIPGLPVIPPFELTSLSETSLIFQQAALPVVMQTHNWPFAENYDFNPGSKEIRWQGGYNGDYSSVTGTTRLQGKLTVQGGKLIVERVVVK